MGPKMQPQKVEDKKKKRERLLKEAREIAALKCNVRSRIMRSIMNGAANSVM